MKATNARVFLAVIVILSLSGCRPQEAARQQAGAPPVTGTDGRATAPAAPEPPAQGAQPATPTETPAQAAQPGPAGSSAPSQAPSGAQQEPAAGAASRSPVSAEQARTDYQAAVAKLKAAIDYSQLDVQTAQAKIGTNPQAIAAFVQNEIGYEAYAGALRGARGTLLSRAGNSIDRALLLAGLLRAAGHKVRFAEGTLSGGQAEQLLRARLKPPAPVDFKSPLNEILDRARGHFVLLGDALYAAGFKAPTGDAARWKRTVREAQQHVWVQLAQGGQWLDVDASPGIAYGRSLVAADRVADVLDPALFHRVEFLVEIERVHDGKRETRRVLESAALAADLAGVPIGLFHEQKAAASTPVLVVGDSLVRGQPFDSPVVIGLGGARAPVVNPFATGADRLSAEWLKVRLTGPSGERQATYTLVDTEGPAARQSGAPPKESPAENTTAVLEALDDFLGIVVATGHMPSTLLAAWLADASDPLTSEALVRLLAIHGAGYLMIREGLPSSFLDPLPVTYVDAPNVIVSKSHVVRGQGVRSAPSVDLTLKAYRVLRTPEDPLSNDGSFYDYLAAGVLDHTVERWMLGGGQAERSVGALFESATGDDVAARFVPPGHAPPVDYLTPDGRWRLSAALDHGQMAVLPAARPKGWGAALGWWTVDPATGWTEDTTEDGYHSAMPEEGSLYARILAQWEKFCDNYASSAMVAWTVATIFGPDGLELAFEDYMEAIQEICKAVATARGAGRPPVASPRPPVPPLAPKPGLKPPPYKPPFKDPGFPTRPPLKWLPGKGRLK